jgi:hypothetical protein
MCTSKLLLIIRDITLVLNVFRQNVERTHYKAKHYYVIHRF